MNTLSLILLVLKFLLKELPDILEAYKLAKKDKMYNNEADRINAALETLQRDSSSREDRLRAARELGR